MPVPLLSLAIPVGIPSSGAPGIRFGARRAMTTGGRCLAFAALACFLTRPLLHPAPQVERARPTGVPVSVEADISRRLAQAPSAVNATEEQVLWAGME